MSPKYAPMSPARKPTVPLQALCLCLFMALALGCSSSPQEDIERRNGLILKGSQLFDAKDYAQSIAVHRELLEMMPYYAPGHFLIGYAEYEQHQYEAVEKALRNGLRYQPCEVPALNLLAILLFDRGNYGECLELSRQVQELEPKFAANYTLMAGAYLRLDRQQEAAAMLEALKSLDQAQYDHVMRLISAGKF